MEVDRNLDIHTGEHFDLDIQTMDEDRNLDIDSDIPNIEEDTPIV